MVLFHCLCSVVSLVFFTECCVAYPGWVRPKFCQTMEPGIVAGVEPQTTRSPYTIFASSTTYHPEEQLTVTIIGPKTRPFTHFILQAREVTSDRIVGAFQIPVEDTYLQLRRCDGVDDTIMHGMCFHDNVATVGWHPPLYNFGKIKFYATVVTDRMTYWRRLESHTLEPHPNFFHLDDLYSTHNHTYKVGHAFDYLRMKSDTPSVHHCISFHIIMVCSAILICGSW